MYYYCKKGSNFAKNNQNVIITNDHNQMKTKILY